MDLFPLWFFLESTINGAVVSWVNPSDPDLDVVVLARRLGAAVTATIAGATQVS